MQDESPGQDRPARYGPFHRLESSTQTAETAVEQQRSGEIWGSVPRGGDWPTVEAYWGPLPDGARGIEFWTDVRPNSTGHPGEARWYAHERMDIRVETRMGTKFAIIPCVIVKNGQAKP